MKLISFNFTKISIERLSDSLENIKINSKINIKDIELLDSSKSNDGLIKITFSYHLEYAPKIANIDLEGRIVLVDAEEKIREISEKWKDKKMTEEFRIVLFNLILKKANLKAMVLEEELKLPLHVPLPSIKPQKE